MPGQCGCGWARQRALGARFRGVLFVLLTVMSCAVVVMGQRDAGAAESPRKIELTDASGRVRIVLDCTGDDPAIKLLRSDGRVASTLQLDRIALTGVDPVIAAEISVADDQSSLRLAASKSTGEWTVHPGESGILLRGGVVSTVRVQSPSSNAMAFIRAARNEKPFVVLCDDEGPFWGTEQK